MQSRIHLALAAVAIGAVLLSGGWDPAAAEPSAFSYNGVKVRILSAPFSGEIAALGGAGDTPPSALPKPVAGYPLLETKTAYVALSPDDGRLTYWTRRDGHLTRRGEIALKKATGRASFQLIADQKAGLAVQVDFQGGGQRQTLAISPDGILEIRQPAGETVVVRSPLRYALAPSLIGTDLLYDPQVLTGGAAYLASLGMVVGLGEGGDGVLVGVWPPGRQLARVAIDENSRPRKIESFAIDTDTKSFYVAFLDEPGIWHEEPLRDEYLEAYTAIGWQRPFDARWIGRMFIDSDGYDFPFYFLSQKQKLWGRYIRGWFEYPVWFDGGKTMVHFEKKFPPKGTMLIYFLDTLREDGKRLSPVAVMRESLGEAEAARLLDFEGTNEQVLLAHRNAVCAMTRKIEAYFAKESGAMSWEETKQYADDVWTFIHLIRERVFQFDRFAAEMQDFLETTRPQQPALAAALKPSEEILAEIRQVAADDLPKTSLDEVRGWTDGLKTLSSGDGVKNLAIAKTLDQKCRSVAGTQDDMARNLSVATIRLMEEAARMGAESPEHVRVADGMIARCRAVLRQPTWWEPCRKYLLKSDPGAP